MKIAYIAAGAGGMYCGNCLHDNTLAAAMLAEGHDVLLIPTYTPLRTDEKNVSLNRVFLGGIHIYLQQNYPFTRYFPRWALRWMDSPRLLRFVTSFGLSTKANELVDLTLSMLKGHEGGQAAEIQELADWLATEVQPDVVHLSNVMLIGMAHQIRERLKVPVFCTISSEDLFLQQLTEPHTTHAHEILRSRAQEIHGFVALNRYYADLMGNLVRVEPDRMHVVPHGLDLHGYGTRQHAETQSYLTIGYLGRITPEKGLELLTDAFIQLCQDERLPSLRLRFAGYLGPSEKPFLQKIEQKIHQAQLGSRFAYVGELTKAEKVAYLQDLDCKCMANLHPESKGFAALEALANAVPVVVPNHGPFPEMIATTNGGLLFEPGNVADLAEKIRQTILDLPTKSEQAIQAQAVVRREFAADLMAQRTIDLYQRSLQPSNTNPPPAEAVR